MNASIAIARKITQAYSAACRPLCREIDMPQTAFDILMFLGNNPEYRRASEIVEIRHIKANLVSVHVERLVQEGYLIRRAVPGDRRKTDLICTERADAVIARGRLLQAEFSERLLAHMDEGMRGALMAALEQMRENLDEMLEEENEQ